MKARLVIEWGNDALSGPSVEAAQHHAVTPVILAMQRGLTEGGFQVTGVDVFPIEVRFKRFLIGPQDEEDLAAPRDSEPTP